MRQFKPGQLQTGSIYPITASYALTASYISGSVSINTGSLVTTASFNAFTASYTTGSFTGSFTGTLIGTASWANNSLTASYAQTASYVLQAVSSSFANTASYVTLAQTASYALQSVSSSFITASNVYGPYGSNSIISSSHAISASYLIGGITIDTGSLVTTASFNSYTSSQALVSASFNSRINTLTGSINTLTSSYNSFTSSYATGSFTGSFTGLLTGTASQATTASYYAEIDPIFTAKSGSFVTTSSFNIFTSSIQGQVNSLTAATSSYMLINNTASMLAPYVLTSSTSSMTVLSSSFASTASFITASNIYGPYGSNSVVSSSYALSASYAVSSSFSTTASYATFAETASSATNAQDILVYVLNNSGYDIAKGVVVRITASGNSSDIPRIVSASYDNDSNSANTLGIAYQSITNGSLGYVITNGILRGIDTSNFVSGQLIYLGASGSIIGSAPQAPLHAVRLGQVVRQQSNNGSIYININNGYELDELHDVRITTASLSYGDLLMRSSSVWINSKQLSGSYALTGSLTATSFTGSLQGTASWANNAVTASFITASNVVGTVTSASYAISASFLQGLNLGLYTTTSSFNSFTSSIQSQVNSLTAATSSYLLTSATASMLAPYVLTSQTASMAVLSASFAQTASFVTASNVVGTVVSASYAVTASYAMNGGSGGGTTFIRRSDYTTTADPNVNYLYLGDAVSGSLESQSVWSISRLAISSSGATTPKSASFVAWTDRYTVTYL